MGETMNAREELSAAIENVVIDLWDQSPSTDLNVRRSLKESIEVNFDDAFVAIANMESALTEKDREIERLKADLASADMWAADHSEYVSPEAYAEMAAHANEGWSLLSASQAREREAVERAEKAEHHERVAQDALSSADCRYAGRVAEMGGSHCPIGEPCDRCAADRRERKLESALAAARKALGTAWAAMCERRGYAEAWEWKYGTTWNEEDAEVSAALNGDSHAE